MLTQAPGLRVGLRGPVAVRACGHLLQKPSRGESPAPARFLHFHGRALSTAGGWGCGTTGGLRSQAWKFGLTGCHCFQFVLGHFSSPAPPRETPAGAVCALVKPETSPLVSGGEKEWAKLHARERASWIAEDFTDLIWYKNN